MDNAPIHNGATFHGNQQQVRKLPPYSPFLNPIEEAFSALKAAIKRRLNDPDIQGRLLDPQGAARNLQTLLGYRMTILEEVAQEILDTREVVNADKCTAFHQHMFAYLLRCINMQNIKPAYMYCNIIFSVALILK